MFIVYTSESEALITTKDKEAETVRLWFTEGGRLLADYDRDCLDVEAVQIVSKVSSR